MDINKIDISKIEEYKILSPSSKRSAVILNYGCILKKFCIMLTNGEKFNCVLSHRTAKEYVKDEKTYMGAFVGRFCGRIKDSRFKIGDKEYTLTPNDGTSHLHGVLSRVIFNLKKHTSNEVVLEYDSPSGEDGFPGNIHIEVQYVFEGETLVFIVTALSDEDTVFAPANHTYFTLSHTPVAAIFKSTLEMNATSFYEINDDLLKTGERIYLTDYPEMDFRMRRSLSELAAGLFETPQIITGRGLDHTFHFREKPLITLENSRLKLDITSSEKNIHVYSGGSLHNSNSYDETGNKISCFAGIAFESDIMGEKLNPNIIRKGEKFITFTSWFIDEK